MGGDEHVDVAKDLLKKWEWLGVSPAATKADLEGLRDLIPDVVEALKNLGVVLEKWGPLHSRYRELLVLLLALDRLRELATTELQRLDRAADKQPERPNSELGL